jgi:hypothetical protein
LGIVYSQKFAQLWFEERSYLAMTMGLKVRQLLSDKEIKKLAEARKAESDAILDNIFGLLKNQKDKKKGQPLKKKE